MCNLPGQFDETFRSLTGNPPFPWQRRLYEKWVSGNFPKSCDLPTGAGKTSVVALWLIALAENPEEIPKRLVYVVNRRTVVDQTTDEVEEMAKKLANADRQNLSKIRAKLSRLSAIGFSEKEGPLAISTLRGQMADNRAWSADPCRPAVIIGTVDMIGSRLLFGGYRIGFKSRPLHAGFLGKDALLIHDEAHLEPAFQTLAEAIVQQQKEDGQNATQAEARQIQLVSLTATPRNDAEESFHLESDDDNHRILSRRLHAPKNLRLHSIDDPKQLPEEIVKIALKHEDYGKPILIYARKVDDVKKIVDGLKKSNKSLSKRVLSLTGTMRGLERDKLTQNPINRIFQRFLPQKNKTNGRVSSAENNQMAFSELSSATESEVDKSQSNSKETVYLVCTSAGEVGINLSAKHLVCDLSAFESMAQRFGRVNRFGDPEPLPKDQQTRIDVVYPPIEEGKKDWEKRYNAALKKTLTILKSLNGDASPHSLRETLSKISAEKRKAAFSPEPEILPTSDLLFDAWTMTTVKGELPGRPPLADYLHGVSEYDPPQTTVAWREEVERITGDLLQEHPPEDLLEAFPLKPHELLSDRSKRVFDHLQKIAERHPDKPVWLIDESNHVEFSNEQGEPLKMGDLTEKERIQHKTVLLSHKVGGLREGLLSGETEATDITSLDVSWQWRDENGKLQQWTDEKGQPRRKRCYSREEVPTGWRFVHTINLSQSEEDEVETEEEPSEKIWYWCENPRKGDGEGYTSAEKEVSLESHTNDVAQIAEAFAKWLKLDAEIALSLKWAARWHDLGKNREHWQRSIGNPNPQKCLAKSGPGMIRRHLGHYRHEFGSLIDAEKEPEFAALSPDAKDLTLHLISAHHGRARPHFPQKEVFDPDKDNPLPKAQKIADETPLRFERLQRRYGRWGLAYLESLLRAADYAASAGLTAKKEIAK